MIKALSMNFPDTKINGCLFHFKQNIIKRIKKFGLHIEYGTNIQMSTQVKMLMSLPFCQPTQIDAAFQALKDVMIPQLEPLFDWFEANYVAG